MVGLGNVDNTSDANKPISNETQNALDAKADKTITYTKNDVDQNISNLIASAPDALNTLNEVGSGIGERSKLCDTTVVNQVAQKADKSTTYTKTEANQLTTYTKTLSIEREG